ncbi:MAG: hypothetical protein RLZZ230_187 [Candidatus Parcubacteria bacterium]|jgi:methionyl-tRNA formyltransferase
MNKPIFAFFGGEPLAVPILNKLKKAGLVPTLIICNPDRPSGREHALTSPPAKDWAIAEGIEVFQPTTYKDDSAQLKLAATEWDLFVVVAYNFILPEWLIALPKKGIINVHPSMLPKLRGASPIRTAILLNIPEDIGVTIMQMDKEMDHGPILEQEQLQINSNNWPISGPKLDIILAKLGGDLLVDVIPAWLEDAIIPQEQEHEHASYCSKLSKADSELTIDPLHLPAGMPARKAWHTINAFAGIGDTFFIYAGKRIKITEAEMSNGGTLQILKVIPEGKKEISYPDFLKNYVSK